MQKIRLYNSLPVRTFAITLCILLASFIFIMSAQSSDESAELSGGLTEKILTVFISDFDKMSAEEREDIIELAEHILRKTAHFCLYALLGALVCFASLGFDATRRAHVIRSLCISALYAASDEVHQYFVPGRGPGVGDVILDSAGALCGAVFFMLVANSVLRCRNNV